ncbi:MAG: hypothetical protein ACQCXQ_08160 [Verrucomicrobiales bacterium]|nr:hypothetical protein [Verrucomicrobiota bacterium JB025]
MKKLALLLSLAALALGMSSCCTMFGGFSRGTAGYTTETKQVRTCGYDIITEEVAVPGDAKSGKGGMVETIEKKVPRYKTVEKKVRQTCGSCTRFFCPKPGCCGSTGESTIKMATSQPAVGSPFIGLVPTMKELPQE